MRILVWHGWLLDGTGSNVFTARTVEAWRREGHDVLLLCQDPHPERFRFVDAVASPDDPASSVALDAEPAPGRIVVLRPDIGDLLPVFVWDEYEGFRVTTFVDLTDEELHAYVEANVTAMRSAAVGHRPELVVVGHAVPGPAVARRALQGVPYVAKIHGSDVEYAMRRQERYVELAREGLEGAAAITGSSRDVNERLVELVPSIADRLHVVPPGVAADRFRPAPRPEALLRAAERLEHDPTLGRGRPSELAGETAAALRRRDAAALDALARRYEQSTPDADAPARLRALAHHEGPLVGYLGKLIPQKGVHQLLAALPLLRTRPRTLVIGFGTFREWLEALAMALDAGDPDAVTFLRDGGSIDLGLREEEIQSAAGLAADVTFTGLLDHRYAPDAVAAVDVLVVPSILEEAFGMVALEAAAAGTLPLVARHSGLAEIAAALEGELGEPGLLSFEPGPGAFRNLAAGLDRLLAIPEAERRSIGLALSTFVGERWGWDRTAAGLLAAAGATRGRGRP